MTCVLAIDAGGTHTRAACVDEAGTVLGWGAARGGNATALGDEGLTAVEGAARAAIDDAGVDAGTLTAVLCAAGEAPVEKRAASAQRIGLSDPSAWHVVGDALGAYFSGSSAPDGIVLVAGTGAVAARVESSTIVEVVDGLGWLLGDKGGGFWIGREVVVRVAEALDGRGCQTALTQRVLERIRGEAEGMPWSGVRSQPVSMLLRTSYMHAPLALADFATLAFDAAAQGDDVAAAIVDSAAHHLADTLETVRTGHEHLPVVLAGSVLTRGLLPAAAPRADVLHEMLRGADVRHASDGVVGAAVLALRRGGVEVTEALRENLAEQVALRRP